LTGKRGEARFGGYAYPQTAPWRYSPKLPEVKIRMFKASNHRLLAARVCALFAALMINVGSLYAGQTSAQFNVTVQLQSNALPLPGNGFCRITDDPRAFGAAVTVACSTGTVVELSPGRAGMPVSPMHGGAYRFITQIWGAGPGVFDAAEDGWGAGTTTSWRVIHLANREYVEMTVAW